MIEDALQSAADRPENFRHSSPVLKFGFYTGLSMIAEMLAALIVINRVPALDPYALGRNAFFYGFFIVLMLVPVCRFLASPVRMFCSAMIAWVIFVIAYDLAGLYFEGLFDELHRSPFVALVEGAAVYGTCAVAFWVVEMIVHACRHSIAPDRRTVDAAARHLR